MSLFRFFFSKAFILNVTIVLLLVIGVLGCILKYLDVITLHGESISVPNVSGYTIPEVDTILSDKKLRYLVSDSVYMQHAKKGAVVEQDPKAGDKVKEEKD